MGCPGCGVKPIIGMQPHNAYSIGIHRKFNGVAYKYPRQCLCQKSFIASGAVYGDCPFFETRYHDFWADDKCLTHLFVTF